MFQKYSHSKLVLTIVLQVIATIAFGQTIKPYQPPIDQQWLSGTWKAFWITENTTTPDNYKVCHYRKTITLTSKPDSFWVHISGDNAYQLFVNGHPVCTGPARGDALNWYFETIDLAPWLNPGTNTLAAVVWNFGKFAPNALRINVDYQLAFILQGNSDAEQVANTNESWRVTVNNSYSPVPYGPAASIGAFERIETSRYPWGWEKTGFDDTQWTFATTLQPGFTVSASNNSWFDRVLRPRELPLIEEEEIRFHKVIRHTGRQDVDNFILAKDPIRVAPRSRFSLLLDNATLTTAYPELLFSRGKGAVVTLNYAEALVDSSGHKGNRNSHQGRVLLGPADTIIADGGENRLFRPLWYRTYRYVQLTIETAAEEIEIHQLTAKYSAYPFYDNARFQSDAEPLSQIWDCAWRTARLCAHTTYMDCPFYEQLQYIGDTRIQALISLYVSGDDRLMRKALCDFDQSRFPNGLTCSSYPSRGNQIIPPFSLFWILMIDDYRMNRPDSEFCRSFEGGIRQVIDWHLRYINRDNMLQDVPFWNFVDWPAEWPWVDSLLVGGVPEGGKKGESSILSLQLAYTLDRCSQMFASWGLPEDAARYARISENIKQGTMRKCWDEKKGLLADSPAKTQFSQHANVWLPLCNIIPAAEQPAFIQKILTMQGLIQCTLYYRFYLFEAMRHAGLSDLYLENLGPWHTMLSLGLTTFAETPEPTRSDCHAWSASPLYHLQSLVAGIEPLEAGFERVLIKPNPGPLKIIKTSFPHYKGLLTIDLNFLEGYAAGTVTLPEGLNGQFVWQGKTMTLQPGVNKIGKL